MTIREYDNMMFTGRNGETLVYYEITVFPDPKKSGYTLKNGYKTLTGARRAAKKAGQELNRENIHPEMIIRKNTVYARIPGKCEYSTSDPAEKIKM